MGGSFLYYADRFKLYSAFCASHTKVPKVLVKGKSGVLVKQTTKSCGINTLVWAVLGCCVDDEMCLLYTRDHVERFVLEEWGHMCLAAL